MDYIIGQNPSSPKPGAPGAAPSASGAADLITDGTEENFMQTVVDASRTTPVLVDFWATWCGPCKQLTPVLEKVVTSARGRIRLVKVDVDACRRLVAQLAQMGLPLQSVPVVVAFWKGQILDLFQGAQPESAVSKFVAGVLQSAGGGKLPAAEMLSEAKTALETNQPEHAAELFSAVIGEEAENPAAWAGLIRAMLALDNEEAAAAALADVPEAIRVHPEVEGARAEYDLRREGRRVAGEADALRARIAKNPDDFEARMELASALNVAGHREEAVSELLAILKADRDWKDGAARQLLFRFFEAWGHDDPATLSARRRLSSLLFS